MKYDDVDLSELDLGDRTFQFRNPSVPTPLLESISQWGVLSPIVLRGKPRAWTVVSRHRRVMAAVAGGIDRVPAWMAREEELSLGDAFRRLIEENRFVPGPTFLESGRLLTKFLKYAKPSRHELEVHAGRLGVPGGHVALDRVLDLPDLPRDILEDPEAKDGVLMQIVRLPVQARLPIWEGWVRPARPTVQQAREAVEWILDLSAGGAGEPVEIIRSALHGEGVFLARLRAERYPRMTTLEERFLAALEDLPGRIKADLHPGRENDTLRFRFEARTTGEIKALARELAEREPALEALFEASCKPPSQKDSSSSRAARKSP
ncbi:MAG: hypothetical protein ACYTFG_02065 [Planctomycetota bacterium]|jgi:hypothetical protein